MGNEVYANGREVSCKAGSGKSICAFPDVCMTPPQTPATPPGVPIPYPNTGMASDMTEGSKSVKISSKEVILKDKSYFKKSMGDEAGCAPMKGVVTHKNMGKVYFTVWSMDVKFEGENVVRHMDLTTHNHASLPTNTPPWPYLEKMSLRDQKKCAKEKAKEQEACGYDKSTGSYSKSFDECCKDPKCQKARKCMLVPYRSYSSSTGEMESNCCPGQTPHHLVETHGFCEEGERGTPLGKFSSPPYSVNKAPCVCAAGSRFEAEHGAFHALQGKRETRAFRKAKGKKYGWTYKQAKNAGADAHRKIFPGSKCSAACLKAQVDSYHNDIGVDDDTTLRTYDASKNVKPWQLQSVRKIIAEMKKQVTALLGASSSGAALFFSS